MLSEPLEKCPSAIDDKNNLHYQKLLAKNPALFVVLGKWLGPLLKESEVMLNGWDKKILFYSVKD